MPDAKTKRACRYSYERMDAFAALDVDPQLGAHTDADLVFAAADGGVIEAGDEGEVLDEDGTDTDGDDDGRADECECEEFHADTDLPCWPCHAAGFSTPATAEGDGA